MALDVLAHAAAEYISNLGRTLRFYSDRFGREMAKEVSEAMIDFRRFSKGSLSSISF